MPVAPAAWRGGDGRREANAAAVLRTVLDHGPVARTGIARLSGLSAAAVSRQAVHLIELGLVREVPGAAAAGAVGRPQVPLDLDTHGPLVAGVHIGVPFSSLALLDLRGRVVAQRTLSGGVRSGLPPELRTELPEFLAEAAPGRRVLGLGAIAGGWIDPQRGLALRHEPLGWRDVPLQAQLEQIGGLPVQVDNHARAVVQSEMLFGPPEARRSVVHLFVGSVVDAAFGIAGVVHQGPGAAAGDVAHLPTGDTATVCGCGRTGCLQVAASDLALVERARSAGLSDCTDAYTVVGRALGGDARADALLRERLRLVARAAALLVDALNPELILLTEPSVAASESYLALFRRELASSSRVAREPERVRFPHAGVDVMRVAAGTAVLAPLFRDPLRFRMPAGPVRPGSGSAS
ncbi:ROK family transcriptional regulator [Streptacidiphilus sp. P02-A3a]|nr:ROK family transcriptional regulator [Streptacidiphilus sp. P02-A3a]